MILILMIYVLISMFIIKYFVSRYDYAMRKVSNKEMNIIKSILDEPI